MPELKQPNQATYLAALMLVAEIEYVLARGRHYRTTSGQCLYTLNEVVEAILNGTLCRRHLFSLTRTLREAAA